MCNVSRANPGNLAQKIADIYLAEALEPERSADEEEVTLSEEEMQPLAGIYWRRKDDATRRIILKEGKLILSNPNREVELVPISSERFRLGEGTRELRFEGTRRLIEPAGRGKPGIFELALAFDPTTEQLNEFAGSYVSEEIETVYQVAVEEGKLVLSSLKTRPVTLNPTVKDVFSNSSANLRFTRDSEGKVVGAILNRGRVRNFRFSKR
jgi:hypothetical protein